MVNNIDTIHTLGQDVTPSLLHTAPKTPSLIQPWTHPPLILAPSHTRIRYPMALNYCSNHCSSPAARLAPYLQLIHPHPRTSRPPTPIDRCFPAPAERPSAPSGSPGICLSEQVLAGRARLLPPSPLLENSAIMRCPGLEKPPDGQA